MNQCKPKQPRNHETKNLINTGFFLLTATAMLLFASTTGPITISGFQKVGGLRETLTKDGIQIGLPGQ